MPKIGVDIEARVDGADGLDKGLNEAEKRVEEFSKNVEKSSGTIGDSARKAGETLGQVGRDAVRGDFSRIPETLGRAALSAGAVATSFGLLALGVAALGVAWYKGDAEARAFEKSLILTGNAAGTSAGQMMDMARAVAEASGSTQGAAAEALNALLASGQAAAGSLKAAGEAAVNLERYGGQAIMQTVKEFESLGQEPVKASERLNAQYHYLTAAVYEQIRALEDQGREEDAAALAQDAYTSAMNARAEKLKANLGIIASAWDYVKQAAKLAWDTMLGIGRETSLTQKLAEARDLAESGRARFYPGGQAAADDQVARLQAQLVTQLKTVDAQDESNKQAEAAIKWANSGEQYRSRQLIMEQEIAKARKVGADAGKSEAEIAARVAGIREKYTPKGRSGGVGRVSAPQVDEYERLINRLSGLDANYGKELDILYGAYQKGRIGIDDYRAAVELLIARQPFAAKAAQEEKRALDEQQKVLDFTAQAYDRAGKAMTEFTIRTEDRVNIIARQIELLGKTPDEAALINAFADVERQADAARVKLEELRESVVRRGGDPTAIDHLIAQLPELASLARDKAASALDDLREAQDKLNASWEYGASEALRKYIDEVDNVARRTEDLLGNAFRGVEKAMADFLFNPWDKGVKGMLQSFGTVVQRMIADAVAADLQRRLLGALGSEGGGAGVLGTVAKFVGGTSAVTSVASGLPGDALDNLFKLSNNFASYDVGTDFVPYDQLARIHRGEKIVPAAQNATGKGAAQPINITLNLSGSNSAPDVRRAGGQVAREVASAVQKAQRYA